MDLRDALVIGIGMVVMVLLSDLQVAVGIRFVMDREECFSHDVQYDGDTVHISFVVIKADAPWHFTHDGVDLVVSLFLFFSFFFCVHFRLDKRKFVEKFSFFFPKGKFVFPGMMLLGCLGNANFSESGDGFSLDLDVAARFDVVMVLYIDLNHDMDHSCQTSVINIHIMNCNTPNGVLFLKKRRNVRT